ncbi:MAG: F0F1 ATP synthase subunit A [Armatimonadota bacterium]
MHEEHGSWLKPIVDLLPASWHGFVDLYVVTTWLIILVLVALAWLGTRRRQRVPSGLQNVWEMYVVFVRNFCVEQIGPGAEKYAPLLGTLFVYILFMNLFGLVPGFVTPTMSLNVTAALALSVFLFVQYSGFAERGLGYLRHFIGEPIVEYSPTAGYFLALPAVVAFHGVLLIVHIIGELAKPLSLAVRLFGNMFGEETAIFRMAALGAALLPFVYVPIPVQFVNVLLHLIIGPIQAFIFFILSAAYIEMATSSHEDEQHEHHHSPEHATEPAEQAA